MAAIGNTNTRSSARPGKLLNGNKSGEEYLRYVLDVLNVYNSNISSDSISVETAASRLNDISKVFTFGIKFELKLINFYKLSHDVDVMWILRNSPEFNTSEKFLDVW